MTLQQQDLIKEGREWLCDCFIDDIDEIHDLEGHEIIKCIDRYFEGGINEFKKCCNF
jgi:hypothetical protein